MGAKQKRFKTEEKDWIDYRKDLAELQKEIRRQLREFNETMEAIREEAETLQTSCWVENEEDSGFDVLASLEFKYLSENIRQLLELICSLEGRLTRPPGNFRRKFLTGVSKAITFYQRSNRVFTTLLNQN